MLIPINDDIRYLNFHVLWLKVEWIDLTFMPCEYFGTSVQCDGCQQKFSVRHALECKRGGLVISRHNEIWDELSDLASKAFSPQQFATNQESTPVALQSQDQALGSQRAQLSSASSKTIARKTVATSWFEASGLAGLIASSTSVLRTLMQMG
jgi:hypothetical protein